MRIKSVILLGPALLLSSALFAQAQGGPTMGPTVAQAPMDEKQVIAELKKQGADQLLKDLSARGVAFEMDADIEKSLRKAKATDQIIQAVTAAGPKEREAAAKAAAMSSGAVVLAPDESAEFKALQSELDPDKAIALTEAFVQKHPNSSVLSYVYAFEANAYQTKGDAAKIVEYGEKSLDLKKDNLMSLMIVAYAIPTPQFVNLHQADEEKQLTKADGYCQDALTAVDSLKKQAEESDADFAHRKSGYLSSIHADLGMIHLDRAQLGLMGLDKEELVKAEKEYGLAVAGTDHPDPTDYYRLGEAYRLDGKIDDAIAAFTKANEMGQGAVKQYAQQQIENLKKVKAQPAAPAKP
ncbi:MAG: tetratricopeptide repeat protein [Terriglobia bacterium]|jgi:tetratricopeptide (TPR) repeat protein